MKIPPCTLIFFFLIFNTVRLPAQIPFGSEGFKTNWHFAESINAGSLRNICHTYNLSFSDEKSGILSFEINFLAEDNKYTNHYNGLVLFTYQVIEEDTALDKSIIGVSYQKVRFMFQEMPKYQEHTIPPDQLAYIEEFKQYLTGREEEYELTPEGSAFLIIEGFTLVKNSSSPYFRSKGQLADPCRNLLRN